MCGRKFSKYLLIISSILVLVTGLALIGVGVWAKVDSQTVTSILGSFPTLFQHIANLAIGVGVVLSLLGGIGCLGTWKENKTLLTIFITITVLLVLLEIAIIIAILVFNNDIEGSLAPYARTSIQEDYGTATPIGLLASEGWNLIQTQLSCCGFNGGSDYAGSFFSSSNLTFQPWPITCCSLNTGGGYIDAPSCLDGPVSATTSYATQGCSEPLIRLIRFQFVVIGAVIASFLVLHQLALLLALLQRSRSDSYM